MALCISVLLSLESYRHHYWILARQWVASIALVTIGMVWFAARLSGILDQRAPGGGAAVAFVTALGVIVLAVSTASTRSVETTNAADAAVALRMRETDQVPATNDEWVALANLNISTGGPVWPIFRKFYDK